MATNNNAYLMRTTMKIHKKLTTALLAAFLCTCAYESNTDDSLFIESSDESTVNNLSDSYMPEDITTEHNPGFWHQVNIPWINRDRDKLGTATIY